jgi:hypothetical protein
MKLETHRLSWDRNKEARAQAAGDETKVYKVHIAVAVGLMDSIILVTQTILSIPFHKVGQ